MSQSNASASLGPQRNNLGYKELLRLVTRVQQDAQWIRAERPTYQALIDRYSTLIPGKSVSAKAIRGVVGECGLKDFITREYRKGGSNPFISGMFQRINAVAMVVKRLAERQGVNYSEINWDYTATQLPVAQAEEEFDEAFSSL